MGIAIPWVVFACGARGARRTQVRRSDLGLGGRLESSGGGGPTQAAGQGATRRTARPISAGGATFSFPAGRECLPHVMVFPSPHRGVILIVDRDPLLLTGMAAVLHQHGYECHCARDTEAGYKAARGVAPDLVLCDTDLDEESGLDFCRDLKADPVLREIPVMFVSGSRDPQIIDLAQEAGGAYYLSKPFDPNVLIETVDRAMWMPHLIQSRIEAGHALRRETASGSQTARV
jgi:CheY-like chemotaxis protein